MRSHDPPPPWLLQHRQQVGERLRRMRLARQLSQVQLAERAGLDHRTISRAENGVHATDIDILARLARELGVPAWELLHVDGPVPE